MAYIGNTPAEAFSAFQKQDFTTSATTSYTLDHPVANGNEIALFINFVRQEPTAAYTASGTSLTLTSATTSSDDMYCVYLGKAVQTVNPPNSSVGSSQVSADLITGQTALGATPADTDELLISDAGTLKRVDYSYLKVDNTPAFSAIITEGTTQSVTTSTTTKIQFDKELIDTDSAYDPSTNYRFTVPSGEGGKYIIFGGLQVFSTSNDISQIVLYLYKNGSSFGFVQANTQTNGNRHFDVSKAFLVDASASDYFEFFGFVNGTSPVFTGSGPSSPSTGTGTYFSGFKLIG